MVLRVRVVQSHKYIFMFIMMLEHESSISTDGHTLSLIYFDFAKFEVYGSTSID